jgi:hypothetical protein
MPLSGGPSLREGRFGAPRDEDQNEKGCPHHSLHRVLHSRESCSTVTDEIVRIQYLLPHEPLSSSGEPLGAVSTWCRSLLRSTFRIRRRRSELSSKLLSVVLMDSVYHAKAIGLTIPDSILVLAHEVID